MSTGQSYAELFVADTPAVLAARDRAVELGCPAIPPGVGSLLTFLAAATCARAIVEVGTGAGVSTLHLVAGMAPDGIVTSIDTDAGHQRAAKEALADAEIAPGRTRLINGRALDVLPRLTDGGYDLVFVDACPDDYPLFLVQAKRLLRIGGVVAFSHGLWQGKVSDPTQRDGQTVAVRETGRSMREDEQLLPVILPLGDGVLAAVRVQ